MNFNLAFFAYVVLPLSVVSLLIPVVTRGCSRLIAPVG